MKEMGITVTDNSVPTKAPERNTVLNLNTTVIEGDELKALLGTVFEQMAYHVAKTYGPFGENTIYQEGGRLLTTKDGWAVEQGILYKNNTIASMVRKMIIDVSTSINTLSGDGTSTGLIAANEVNKLLTAYKESTHIHSKFLSSTLQYCVQKICEKLKKSATPVTKENMAEIIYNIAMVSLDWDSEFASFIRDIYVNTSNTVIRVQNSGTESSYVEYREGYDLSAKLIGGFKTNNVGEHKYNIKNPVFLLFSYTINASLFRPLVEVATAFAMEQKRELVVLAPNFEKDFRDAYEALCIATARTNKPLPNITLVRYFAEYNIEREMIIDFCFLTGAKNIAKEETTFEEIIREYSSIINMNPPSQADYVDEAGKADQSTYLTKMRDYQKTIVNANEDLMQKMEEYVGGCENFEVDQKNMVVSGFGELEKSQAIQMRINSIQAEIDKAMKEMTAKSVFTDEIKLKSIRLGKLRLKMGTIYVGGFGESQLKAKRDALDDAINACKNAYTDGVIVGGGVAIPYAIRSLLFDIAAGTWCPSNEKMDTETVKKILEILEEGFRRTMFIMISNRYPNGIVDDVFSLCFDDAGVERCQWAGIPEGYDTFQELKHFCDMSANLVNPKIPEIIEYSLRNHTAWNLITKTLDADIIHPVRVETEVLKGLLNLVLVTTTSNQLIHGIYEDMEKELKGMREVTE